MIAQRDRRIAALEKEIRERKEERDKMVDLIHGYREEIKSLTGGKP